MWTLGNSHSSKDQVMVVDTCDQTKMFKDKQQSNADLDAALEVTSLL